MSEMLKKAKEAAAKFDHHHCEGVVTRVRAAENFVFFLVANRVDAEGDADFLGKSQIIGPLGNVLVNAGTEEGIVSAAADISRARNKTIAFKAGEFELSPWKDRRPATYRLD